MKMSPGLSLVPRALYCPLFLFIKGGGSVHLARPPFRQPQTSETLLYMQSSPVDCLTQHCDTPLSSRVPLTHFRTNKVKFNCVPGTGDVGLKDKAMTGP